jgi:hypothetical protein
VGFALRRGERAEGNHGAKIIYYLEYRLILQITSKYKYSLIVNPIPQPTSLKLHLGIKFIIVKIFTFKKIMFQSIEKLTKADKSNLPPNATQAYLFHCVGYRISNAPQINNPPSTGHKRYCAQTN